jgi:hypothetical protein
VRRVVSDASIQASVVERKCAYPPPRAATCFGLSREKLSGRYVNKLEITRSNASRDVCETTYVSSSIACWKKNCDALVILRKLFS